MKFSDARDFGSRQKTLSVDKIYLKFKKVGAMNVERRYKFNAAARCVVCFNGGI